MEEKQEKKLVKEVEPKVKKKDSKIKKVVVGVACALVLATAIVVPTTLHFLNNTEYTIVLDYGMLEREDESLTFKKGSTLADIEVPEQEGFVFAGFYADEDFSKPLDPSTEIIDDMTIYLKYEAETVDVILNYGVLGQEEQTVQVAENSTLADLEIPASDDQFVFGGFFSDESYQTRLDKDTVVSENMKIYLQYLAVTTEGLEFAEVMEDDQVVGYSVSDYTGSETNVVIPAIYNGLPVLNIGYRAFFGSDVISIVIPEGVTSIGNEAFAYCRDLKTVKIGNGVTSIGEGAFNESSLTSIEIPDSVTSIESGAFAACSGLTSIEIPDSVTSIKGGVFAGSTNLTSLVVNENNGVYTSRDDSGKEVNCILEKETNILITASCSITEIPEGVISIGDRACASCWGLTSIEIPNSVTSIGHSAFYNCSSLTTIEIPNSVTSIGDRAFSNCSRLKDITIDSVYAYTNLSASASSCGSLGQNATTIRVLKSVVDDPNNTNTYLNDTSNFTKADGEGEFADYYVYTKV